MGEVVCPVQDESTTQGSDEKIQGKAEFRP